MYTLHVSLPEAVSIALIATVVSPRDAKTYAVVPSWLTADGAATEAGE